VAVPGDMELRAAVGDFPRKSQQGRLHDIGGVLSPPGGGLLLNRPAQVPGELPAQAVETGFPWFHLALCTCTGLAQDANRRSFEVPVRTLFRRLGFGGVMELLPAVGDSLQEGKDPVEPAGVAWFGPLVTDFLGDQPDGVLRAFVVHQIPPVRRGE